jgi:uncharacterized membrane protein
MSSFLNTLGQGFTTVANDQLQAFTDPKVLVPNVVGIVCVLIGIVIASNSCKEENDDGNGCTYSMIFVVLGICVLLVSNVVLFLLHPRAALEDMVANTFFN